MASPHGEVYVDTSDADTPYRWTGTEWRVLGDLCTTESDKRCLSQAGGLRAPMPNTSSTTSSAPIVIAASAMLNTGQWQAPPSK